MGFIRAAMPPPDRPGPVPGAAPACRLDPGRQAHARAVSPIVPSHSSPHAPVNVGSPAVMLPHLAVSEPRPPGPWQKHLLGAPLGSPREPEVRI